MSYDPVHAKDIDWGGQGTREEWPDPEPLPEGLPPVETLDPILLPDSVRSWVEDIAERMQCPIEYSAIGVMVALASLIGRQLAIRPKRFDDWTVVPNLWGAIIGPPGVMKSPAMSDVLTPLQKLEVLAKERFEEEVRQVAAREVYAQANRKALRSQIEKALRNSDHEVAERLSQTVIENEEAFIKPSRHRYLANDTTVEKLGELLAENPRGIMLFRDELTGWLRSLDLKNQQHARKFFLEAWNGNGRYTIDRIGRGTIDIEACCVSILGTIQPGPLGEYLRGALAQGVGDDGLLQRFQLVVWPDLPAQWKNVDRSPDREARERAFGSFVCIDRLDVSKFHAETEEAIPFMRFGSEAQDRFDEWRARLENRVRSGNLHPAFEAHLSKYRSLIPSLALIIHVASEDGGPVSERALLKSIAWGEFLETHARRLYRPALDPDLMAARELIKHLEQGELSNPFTARDVYRKCWSGLDGHSTKRALEYLSECGWLMNVVLQTGGRPTTAWWIHPNLWMER